MKERCIITVRGGFKCRLFTSKICLIVCFYCTFELYTGGHAAQRQSAQHGGGPRAICYRGQGHKEFYYN